MERGNSGRGSSFERWSAAAFVVAGVAWFGDAILLGLELARLYPSGVINSGLVLAGLLCSLIGLLLLYPRMAVGAPRPALASAVLTGAGGAAIVGQVVWGTAAMLVLAVSTPPGITTLVLGVLVLGGFVSSGITILHTGEPSRLIGVLVLTSAVAFVGAAVSTGLVQFGLIGVLCGVSITIGGLLRSEARSPPTHPAADATA